MLQLNELYKFYTFFNEPILLFQIRKTSSYLGVLVVRVYPWHRELWLPYLPCHLDHLHHRK